MNGISTICISRVGHRPKLTKIPIRKHSKDEHLLFNFFFYYINSIFLRIKKFISGTAKITKYIVSTVIQQNIFHLKRRKPINWYYFQNENYLFITMTLHNKHWRVCDTHTHIYTQIYISYPYYVHGTSNYEKVKRARLKIYSTISTTSLRTEKCFSNPKICVGNKKPWILSESASGRKELVAVRVYTVPPPHFWHFILSVGKQ